MGQLGKFLAFAVGLGFEGFFKSLLGGSEAFNISLQRGDFALGFQRRGLHCCLCFLKLQHISLNDSLMLNLGFSHFIADLFEHSLQLFANIPNLFVVSFFFLRKLLLALLDLLALPFNRLLLLFQGLCKFFERRVFKLHTLFQDRDVFLQSRHHKVPLVL